MPPLSKAKLTLTPEKLKELTLKHAQNLQFDAANLYNSIRSGDEERIDEMWISIWIASAKTPALPDGNLSLVELSDIAQKITSLCDKLIDHIHNGLDIVIANERLERIYTLGKTVRSPFVEVSKPVKEYDPQIVYDWYFNRAQATAQKLAHQPKWKFTKPQMKDIIQKWFLHGIPTYCVTKGMTKAMLTQPEEKINAALFIYYLSLDQFVRIQWGLQNHPTYSVEDYGAQMDAELEKNYDGGKPR